MYDWIVIGGGITGISLSFELQKVGLSTLLIEQHSQLQGASSLGYGGIPYWSGTNALTRQLCEEGIKRQRQLPDELGMDTEFRDIDLLLTLEPDADPNLVMANYANCAIAPQFLNPQEAVECEPLLNPDGISGALRFGHGHINLDCFVTAHSQNFQRLGGAIAYSKVKQLLKDGDRITGVATDEGTYHSDRVIVCAGGISRALLKASGIEVKVYFTHAEAIDTEAVDLHLRTMVMPANSTRNKLEEGTNKNQNDAIWDNFGGELAKPSIDAGAIQFCDRRIRFGQLSRVLTDPYAVIDPHQSENAIRSAVAKVLPQIAQLKGKWRKCLVAFALSWCNTRLHKSLPVYRLY